jgi:hypothetical protein
MPDKRSITSSAGGKGSRKSTRMSPEQRNRRLQAILFGLLALLMVFSMIISLVAR